MVKGEKKQKCRHTHTRLKPSNLQSFLPMNRKGECEFLGPVGRCEPSQRPHSPPLPEEAAAEQSQQTPLLFCAPAMAATASASWHHPGGKDKMTWKVLVIMALLQAQLPVTGKAGRIDGKELLETLWACVCCGGRVMEQYLGLGVSFDSCSPQIEGRLSREGQLHARTRSSQLSWTWVLSQQPGERTPGPRTGFSSDSRREGSPRKGKIRRKEVEEQLRQASVEKRRGSI